MIKTYSCNSAKRFKDFDMSLDVRTALCKKAWYMFDDSGETATCTFRPDGILLISAKGETCKMTWQYAQRSHSLKPHGDGKEWELHTVFMDGALFMLQADDTLRYAFFTDEKSPARFIPELETVLERYFIDKEQEKQNTPITPPKVKNGSRRTGTGAKRILVLRPNWPELDGLHHLRSFINVGNDIHSIRENFYREIADLSHVAFLHSLESSFHSSIEEALVQKK